MKSKVGLLLPNEIVAALEEASGKSINGKQKWVAYSAAILLFASAPQEVRSFFLRSVWGATIDDDFADLSRRVQSGELQNELASYLASKGIDWSFGPATAPAADEETGTFPGKIVSKQTHAGAARLDRSAAPFAVPKARRRSKPPKTTLK